MAPALISKASAATTPNPALVPTETVPPAATAPPETASSPFRHRLMRLVLGEIDPKLRDIGPFNMLPEPSGTLRA